MRQLVALLVLCSAFAVGQDAPRNYGKSDAQILAMGQDKWMEFTGNQDGGGSNLGMIQAEQVYTKAAAGRNDRLSARKHRTEIGKLRQLLVDYEGQLCIVGSYISGGGSMWATFDAGGVADVEDVLYQVLGGTRVKAKPFRTSKVVNELNQARLEIVRHRSNDEFGNFKMTDAQRAWEVAHQDYLAIAAIAAKLDRRSSDAILSFCFDRAKLGAEGV